MSIQDLRADIIRERGGNSLPAGFKSEAEAIGFIGRRVRKGTIVNADEAPSWGALHARFEMTPLLP
jgi:hypothetical protein